MAIQQRTVNGSYTEIYVGGGNSLTQAYSTNFHQFWLQKILEPSEDISDFREVTASERAAIEAQDAKWEPWSEELIAQWSAAGCYFNRSTGFGELNGLKDITASQARAILYLPLLRENEIPGCFGYHTLKLRTNLCFVNNSDYSSADFGFFATYQDEMETVRITNNPRGITSTSCRSAFTGCVKLREILGIMVNGSDNVWINTFDGCVKLEEVKIKGLQHDITFNRCPLLSPASMQYMVTNAANTKPITITLHPTAYARVTDELFALAAEKQITFATT